jgi:hypothetical protein
MFYVVFKDPNAWWVIPLAAFALLVLFFGFGAALNPIFGWT